MIYNTTIVPYNRYEVALQDRSEKRGNILGFFEYAEENFDHFFKIFKSKNSKNYEKKYHPTYTSIKNFEDTYKDQRYKLLSAIQHRYFKASPLYPVLIPNKANPSKPPRMICIPTVQDRLIQTLLINYLAKELSNELLIFKASDYAVAGLGVVQARNKAKSLRTRENFVLKTDISSFFDNLDRGMLLNDLRQNLPAEILYLFESIVRCDPIIPQDYNAEFKKFIRDRRGKGVRQGMPLSPLLASFYLAEFDEWLNRKTYNCVRYADDLIFFLDSEDQGKLVFEEVKQELLKLGLSLPSLEDNAKTQLIKPLESVSFLGLDLRCENGIYNWYIPQSVIDSVRKSLDTFTNVPHNMKSKLSFSKTITRMDQIVMGYEHCFSDAESKNIKDFHNRLAEEKNKAINKLFKNIGIDISTLYPQYKNYFLGK